jgi:hypothetical protein
MLIHDKTDIFLYDEALLASRNTTSQYIQRVYTLQYIHQAKTKFSIDVIKKVLHILFFFWGRKTVKIFW